MTANSPEIIIEIADMAVSADPQAVLKTFALGSCIAVMVYDSNKRIGGLIHYMLPLSKTNPAKAAQKPAMFADTGVIALFNKMFQLGCEKKDLIVKVAGGGKLQQDNGLFDIGRRNYTVLRKILWNNEVVISAEDVGGTGSRNAQLSLKDGKVVISSKGKELVL